MDTTDKLEELQSEAYKHLCESGNAGGLMFDLLYRRMRDTVRKTYILGIQEGVRRAEERVEEFLNKMSKSTFDNTLKGKNSPFEVTDEEWQNCSFSFDDLLSALRDLASEVKETV